MSATTDRVIDTAQTMVRIAAKVRRALILNAVLLALLVLGVIVLLTSCSTSADITERGDGTCVRETKDRFLGVQYHSNEYVIRCADGAIIGAG